MRFGIILVDDEEDFEWYRTVDDCGFEFRLIKRCNSIPDRKNDGKYIGRLSSGKVVLPNRKLGVTFKADSEYLLVDYTERDNYIIANKVYKQERFDDTRKIFLFKNDSLYCVEIFEIEDGIYYEVKRKYIDRGYEYKYINEEREILNIDLVRERLHDYLISEISSVYDVKYTIELLNKIGYNYDLESFAKLTREKFPRVYYYYVQHVVVKKIVEKEVVGKYGVGTIRDMLGYYKIIYVSYIVRHNYNTFEWVLAQLHHTYDSNYSCSEDKPIFKEILSKIKEILKEYTIPDPTRQ